MFMNNIDLKQKTVNGLTWNFIDSFANYGVQFVVGIILARILSPNEFGLIGILTVVIAISQVFIESGFSQALIQKKECSETDYSTVFIFNLIVSILFFLILFFSAEYISVFFKEPLLKNLLRVLATGLIINAFSVVQRTILTKNINFKLQTKISAIASVVSGIVSITMAKMGFGVWSLVALTMVRFTLNTIFLWLWATWKPLTTFSKKSFNELFSFGSKLLISSLIDTLYRNVYYIIIGKYFSATELGFYTRADQFKAMPSQNLQGIISRVSFPALALLQNDIPRLKNAYKRLLKGTMFITFILMLGMAATAESLVVTLIGEKWLPAVQYLQLLCFIGMLYPLHALNLNMLSVQGRSDLFLKLEIIKKILAVPTILIGIFFGIKIMILGMLINSIISFFLNSYWSGRRLNYSSFDQIKDFLPAFFIALIVNSVVFILNFLIKINSTELLILQVLIGIVLTFFICETFKFQDYLYLKRIIYENLTTKIKWQKQ